MSISRIAANNLLAMTARYRVALENFDGATSSEQEQVYRALLLENVGDLAYWSRYLTTFEKGLAPLAKQNETA